MRLISLILAIFLVGCLPALPDFVPMINDRVDADNDGYYADEDCNDGDATIYPTADELCDQVDNDCDGETDEGLIQSWYGDSDGDSYGWLDDAIQACDPSHDYVDNADDCDDTDEDTYPGAPERCDDVDNDCDDEVDEDLVETWYLDEDGDHYGVDTKTIQSCDPLGPWTDNADDCDDSDSDINPDATEVCDGADNDCDSLIDDEDDGLDISTTSIWYLDEDGDDYGDDDVSMNACDQPDGYSSVSGDCDDSDTAFNPAANEDDCTDPNDYNCDGSTGYADDDSDGFAACEECDDSDSSINPDATEVCDSADNDCDGDIDDADTSLDTSTASTWYIDSDSDSYGHLSDSQIACDAPSGYVLDSSDCNDFDAGINPGATEVCDEDNIDEDCDGFSDDDDSSVDRATWNTWYDDMDGDGYGDSSLSYMSCDVFDDYVANDLDCDDGDSHISPEGIEHCDGIDDDCDGLIDDDDPDVDVSMGGFTFYADTDGDSYGDASNNIDACDMPSGYVEDATDCDDSDFSINSDAIEVCDSVDNDCDGEVDEDDAIDVITWYADGDGDSYGDLSSTIESCTAPSGYVSDSTDCNDSDSGINPGATEVCDDSDVDEDCSGLSDDDDSGVDSSTFTNWYDDGDRDGYGELSSLVSQCESPDAYAVTNGEDCDDSDSDINPGVDEVCDEIDNDCDGDIDDDDDGVDTSAGSTFYADTDSDSYGDASNNIDACDMPSGYVSDATDCNDSNSSINPDADEVCDSADNDCDGDTDEPDAIDVVNWYADSDGDSYGDLSSTTDACDVPSGYVADSTDCDDSSADVYPGADEYCDGVDTDCDGDLDEDDAIDAETWYADSDGDSYGDLSSTTDACDVPSGYVSGSTDCDDSDADVYPGADEYCNGYDDDCDGNVDEDDAVDVGTWYYDSDLDGYGDDSIMIVDCTELTGYVEYGGDCDDLDPDFNPGATDEQATAWDEDCDGDDGRSDGQEYITPYYVGNWYASGNNLVSDLIELSTLEDGTTDWYDQESGSSLVVSTHTFSSVYVGDLPVIELPIYSGSHPLDGCIRADSFSTSLTSGVDYGLVFVVANISTTESSSVFIADGDNYQDYIDSGKTSVSLIGAATISPGDEMLIGEAFMASDTYEDILICTRYGEVLMAQAGMYLVD